MVISAPGNSDTNRYIRKLTLNGRKYSHNWLSHKELMKGATLEFEMTDTPDKKRGTAQEDFPYSLSD